jgi:nucleotide-binding universal stress UspA family protein
MPKRARFTVVVATDGSIPAQAAVRAAADFPWPERAEVSVVVARGLAEPEWPAAVREAVERMHARVAQTARRLIARRWPEARARVVDRFPSEGVLAEARRLGADVIVVGSRGHTGLSRLWLGSVSRDVVRRASCPVLVVKGRLGETPRIVAGLDGSANARRVVRFLGSLHPSARASVTLVRVVEPVRPPTLGVLPGAVREALAAEAAALEAQRKGAAARDLEASAEALARAGWRVRTDVRSGVPLGELLAAAREARADLIAIGARGVGGLTRLLLGSVAEGVVTGSSVSVLVVR